MSSLPENLPPDYPDNLRHTDADTPVPTWEQITRSNSDNRAEMIAHLSRIVANTEVEQTARAHWDSWPVNYRRTVGLLVDKIYNEGWLDVVGPINEGWPWDGGFYFWPLATERGTLANVLDSKSGKRGVYTQCDLRSGLFAYINIWNHKDWQRGWMENNAGTAALHIGIRENGLAEVHLEVYNALYTNGAPRKDVMRIPFVGSYNHKLFPLHRRWEQSEHQTYVRTSANFYHLMREENIPLSF